MTDQAATQQAARADESIQDRRKRLRFRSWHRGMREMDLLMGSFADAHVDGFDAGMLDRYEALLELSDPDLYNWMSGREPVPAEHDDDVMRLLTRFRYTPRQGS
ncbi:succinate dehydrogenase assembly factor 2 [Azospirillum doebereinerae]|uniref:FAD assembly factor SdhE n=1 Tax=Azospirillum doebereinerae TaxID=92933 RepID=UPI001EE5BAB4|nr:succinate dehydrogenase assembly factor 2 [Azospirillum doebereinerae]MCG5240879.1 succinate dehydrogenase assembly factor 2 [Azospirillum doebereinerae]